MIQIGFNLLTVGGLIDEAHLPLCERIREIGYDGVEIPVFEGDIGHYERLGRQLDAIGLKRTIVTIVAEDSNPLSPDPAIRQKARERHRWAVDCAATLGATVIAGPYHSPVGVFTGEGPREDELAHLAEALHAMADYAGKAGIALSLEAINRFECYALNTMAAASALKAKVAHPNFGYMYDTFHANIEERDPIGAYSRHAPEINHIHLSENDRGIVGRGHVPWAETFRAIHATGYDGWLTVEAFGRALPSLAAATRVWRDLFPDLDTLLVESHDFIRRGWAQAGAA
jgi:D-psicose/D-tagatose/L-ribulose 3-epimerase